MSGELGVGIGMSPSSPNAEPAGPRVLDEIDTVAITTNDLMYTLAGSAKIWATSARHQGELLDVAIAFDRSTPARISCGRARPTLADIDPKRDVIPAHSV